MQINILGFFFFGKTKYIKVLGGVHFFLDGTLEHARSLFSNRHFWTVTIAILFGKKKKKKKKKRLYTDKKEIMQDTHEGICNLARARNISYK